MKKWTLAIALICLAAGTAFADVSNEVVAGFEGDSTNEVTSTSTGTDLNGLLETSNSLLVAQFTHYFAPLKTDDKPLELRRFYQHPTNLSAGLAFIGSTDKDSTVPAAISETEGSGSMLLLGGEYYFPSKTGLFLNLRAGSETLKETVGGVAQPEVENEFSALDLGVRQYVKPGAAMHLRLHSETIESTQSGFKSTTKKNVTFLGARGVIADVVGLMLELGGGEQEDESGGITIKYDLGAVNAEVAGYIGKQFSIRLALKVETQDMAEPPAGVEHTITTARSTLAAKYWFSERLGMELPLYSETIEKKAASGFSVASPKMLWSEA